MYLCILILCKFEMCPGPTWADRQGLLRCSYLSRILLFSCSQSENMIGLDLLDGHAGNRFIKLANGATASLSLYMLSLCACLPARFTLTKMLMQHSRASHPRLNITGDNIFWLQHSARWDAVWYGVTWVLFQGPILISMLTDLQILRLIPAKFPWV